MTRWTCPPDLAGSIDESIRRLESRLRERSPGMADCMLRWFERLAGSRSFADYFRHPDAFPTLLLPRWLESSLPGPSLAAFQADLVYSSIAGYYYIRMLDNIMDAVEAPEIRFLPLAGFFHAEFHAPYFRYFPPGHLFWSSFDRYWIQSAEASWRDANLVDIDEEAFQGVSARKVCACRIPLAAVCHRHGREKLPDPWDEIVNRVSAWHQMHNDLLDWQRDHQAGIRTWFLCEANRRRGAASAHQWVVREGMAWGIERLRDWLDRLLELAREAGAPGLNEWLEFRQARFQTWSSETLQALPALASLLEVLR